MDSLFNLRTILPCLGFSCFFILNVNVAPAQRPDYRFSTLKHDPQYRLGIAWQNVAFTQPPHAGFIFPQRQMEQLDRGIVALNMGEGKIFVGWRLLGTDPSTTAFDLFRQSGNGKVVQLNKEPIIQSTSWIDSIADLSVPFTYFVKVAGGGSAIAGQPEARNGSYTLPAKAPERQYLSIPLRTIKGYTPGDASVGDLDGDGDYEIILHLAGRSQDNSFEGVTDPPIFDAYQLDGTFLWRINLGKNIREGQHYTQFMVYDLDGDGKAEFACKTADGTIDGKGKVIGDPDANWVNEAGRILDGPEYFTIFDGLTGAALATTNYVPARGDVGAWGGRGGNGGNDSYGNRVDRFLACIAYLDGEHPSVVMCRGYYGRTVLAAWDWRDGKLTSRWVFDTKNGDHPYSGMGNHNLSVGDVDGDGKDEIVYGSMCVNDDGTGLYTTDLRHGDALHLADLDPSKPGTEVWGIHELEDPVPGYENGYGAAMFSAETGEIYWGIYPGGDVGRGVAADIDPRYPGAEVWTNRGELFTSSGKPAGKAPKSDSFVIWWDGDLLRELLSGNQVTKWDWEKAIEQPLLAAAECGSGNGGKGTPALSADILGDWREEVIWRTSDNKELRIYTTIIPTERRFPTLMHDPQYRLSIAWQNVAYNQPPHLSKILKATAETDRK